MAREILFVLAAGVAAGILYSAAFLGSWGAVIFIFLSIFPLVFVGLGRGAMSAGLAGLVGATTVGLLGGVAGSALVFLFTNAIPAAWLSRQALLSRAGLSGMEWYPPGRLVAWLSAFPAVYFLAVVVFFLDAPGGPQEGIAAALGVSPELLAGMFGDAPADGFLPTAADLTVLLPSSLATGWVIMMTLNLLLAQGVLARLNINRRPALSLIDMELPTVLLAAAALAIILAAFPDVLGYIGQTLMVIFLVPYFFLGLALVHTWTRPWPARHFLLFMFYLLLLLIGWLIILVTGMGIVEHFGRFRKRRARASGGRKGE